MDRGRSSWLGTGSLFLCFGVFAFDTCQMLIPKQQCGAMLCAAECCDVVQTVKKKYKNSS
jgi:hypothetical protein